MQVIKKKWSTDVYVDSVVKNFEVFFFPKVTGWFLEREIFVGIVSIEVFTIQLVNSAGGPYTVQISSRPQPVGR